MSTLSEPSLSSAPDSTPPSAVERRAESTELSARERQRVYFGEFSAEIEGGRCVGVFRGYEPVGLSDMPRKVLLILLEQRPKPVLTKHLLSELWHAGANASNAAKQVKALRRALGDDQQRYIRTLEKEGYAFVMPVTVAAKEPASTNNLGRLAVQRPFGTAAGPSTSEGAELLSAAVSPTEWRLAIAKMSNDFRGSCLHDLERLDEAIVECDSRIQLIATHQRLRLGDRFPRGPVFIPRRRVANGRSAPSAGPDKDLAARVADLIVHSKAAPVVVNVGSYSPGCIAVLQSLRRRYGLEVRCDFEGFSGRQQILRLFHDDEADFLFAPHVPFLLVGDYGALDYRRVTPVHAYEQILLEAPGTLRGRVRRLLVYKGGYPEEQLMARVGIPPSAEPEMVSSLESLLEMAYELAPGDMLIAWEPLASGLESKHTFTRLAQYRCWLSLYCHKRWQRGALAGLKNQFAQLFASEWAYCRGNREWAAECLRFDPDALELFTLGSGLRPVF